VIAKVFKDQRRLSLSAAELVKKNKAETFCDLDRCIGGYEPCLRRALSTDELSARPTHNHATSDKQQFFTGIRPQTKGEMQRTMP